MIKLDKQNFLEFRNFALVGIISTIVNYSVFFIVNYFLGVYYIVASSLGFVVGIFISYSLNRAYTFAHANKNRHKEFWLYAAVCVFSLLLSLVCLRIFVESFIISPLIGNVLSIGVSTVTNFVGIKIFVFKKQA
ncbi:MAG: GtrA family protein [bacterium]